MAQRPYWKGYLRLSLVSIAVELYVATESKAEISFRQIHKPTGKRISYTKTAGGEKVDNADIVKGFEIGDDTYVVINPDELEMLRLESTKTIDLVRFVDAEEIDPRYFEKPYYIVPGDDYSEEAFTVIRDALRRSGKVGLAQLATHGREHIVAVSPLGDGMMLEVLRYAEELREPDQLFDDIEAKPPKDMVDLATELIGRKTGPFKPEEFKDHYAAAVRDLVERKRKGQKIVASEAPAETGKVIDLMEALRRSIGERGAASRAQGGHKRAAARVSEKGSVKRGAAKKSAARRTRKAS